MVVFYSAVANRQEIFRRIPEEFSIAISPPIWWCRGNGSAALFSDHERDRHKLVICQIPAVLLHLESVAAINLAALQEAGVLPAMAVNGPRLEAFGIYPSALTLSAQAAAVMIALAGYWWNTRETRAAG